MDQDGSGSFPLSWYIAGFKTVAVKLGQDLTFGIKETKVSCIRDGLCPVRNSKRSAASGRVLLELAHRRVCRLDLQ